MGIPKTEKVDYSRIVERLDYEKLYSDLNWQPIRSMKDEDTGHCLMPNNHKRGDTTGKMAINKTKGLYNCWVCGGGSLISLVMEVKDLDYKKAVEYLYQFVDPVRTESSDAFYSRVNNMLFPEVAATKPLPYFNERVLARYEGKNDKWFKKRGISDEIRSQFRLGVSDDGIILPHFWKGQLVGWQTRRNGKPKYVNTMGFPREDTLWGYDYAMTQPDQPVIVESVATSLFLLSQKIPSIATFGAEVTGDQLKMMRVFQQGVVLAPDNDGPGCAWKLTIRNYLKKYIPVFEVPPVYGPGADLGDLSADELTDHLTKVKRHGF